MQGQIQYFCSAMDGEDFLRDFMVRNTAWILVTSTRNVTQATLVVLCCCRQNRERDVAPLPFRGDPLFRINQDGLKIAYQYMVWRNCFKVKKGHENI